MLLNEGYTASTISKLPPTASPLFAGAKVIVPTPDRPAADVVRPFSRVECLDDLPCMVDTESAAVALTVREAFGADLRQYVGSHAVP